MSTEAERAEMTDLVERLLEIAKWDYPGAQECREAADEIRRLRQALSSERERYASAPRRIQRKRAKGWKMPENTVYVGRPSRFGNRFVVDASDPDYRCDARC